MNFQGLEHTVMNVVARLWVTVQSDLNAELIYRQMLWSTEANIKVSYLQVSESCPCLPMQLAVISLILLLGRKNNNINQDTMYNYQNNIYHCCLFFKLFLSKPLFKLLVRYSWRSRINISIKYHIKNVQGENKKYLTGNWYGPAHANLTFLCADRQDQTSQ